MKIAYLILAHRYPRQLIRLVERLYSPGATFLIHLDREAGQDVEDPVREALEYRSNVRFLPRHACAWGGFGIVEASYQGIKEVVEQDLPADHLVLLSGQDYPIKSNRTILKFFERNCGRSFIHCNPFPYREWHNSNGGWDRVETWNFASKRRLYRIPNKRRFDAYPGLRSVWRGLAGLVPPRRFPERFHPHGGAQFWSLCGEHVRYVYNVVERRPDFYSFFRHVYIPDEILFQTIMGNSPFDEDVYSDTLTFLEWDRPGAVLVSSDLPALAKTSHLFARKFDRTVDAEVLDLIDRALLNACPGGDRAIL